MRFYLYVFFGFWNLLAFKCLIAVGVLMFGGFMEKESCVET